jgi:hypothetical protein
MIHTKTALHEIPLWSCKKIVEVITTTLDTSMRIDRSLPVRQLQSQSTDFTLLRRWVTNCEEAHGSSCRSATSLHNERRLDLAKLAVIDCAQAKIVILPTNHDFVALSYVWGTGAISLPSIQHTRSDHAYARRMLLTSSHSKTIADSMEVVLRLGMRYLWVDKYCID